MPGLKGRSSDQLLAQLLALVHRGRKLEVDLIEHLAEVDARRLYLREGCPSMFAYCVEVLRFAEAVAYKRIAAMRAARRYPELLTTLQKGDLHLTAVSLLAPHLTAKNVTERLCGDFLIHLSAVPQLLVRAHLFASRAGSTRAPRKLEFRKPHSTTRVVFPQHLPPDQRGRRVQQYPCLGHRSRSAMSAT